MANAYATLQAWMEQHHFQIAGAAREVHLIGYWQTTDTAEHVTEIQLPVQSASL